MCKKNRQKSVNLRFLGCIYSLAEFLELVANVFSGSKMCWKEIWYVDMEIRFDVLFPTTTRDFSTDLGILIQGISPGIPDPKFFADLCSPIQITQAHQVSAYKTGRKRKKYA